MQTLPVALIHDIAVSLMGVGVVLIIPERVGTGDEQDCLSAAHLSDFCCVDKVTTLNLQVLTGA